MKKIALVLPEVYPVPAVKGGAIEELVTILIEQNEIEKRVEFVVFSKSIKNTALLRTVRVCFYFSTLSKNSRTS